MSSAKKNVSQMVVRVPLMIRGWSPGGKRKKIKEFLLIIKI